MEKIGPIAWKALPLLLGFLGGSIAAVFPGHFAAFCAGWPL